MHTHIYKVSRKIDISLGGLSDHYPKVNAMKRSDKHAVIRNMECHSSKQKKDYTQSYPQVGRGEDRMNSMQICVQKILRMMRIKGVLFHTVNRSQMSQARHIGVATRNRHTCQTQVDKGKLCPDVPNKNIFPILIEKSKDWLTTRKPSRSFIRPFFGSK